MKSDLLLLLNTTVIVGCIFMAIVFIILPLPKHSGLSKYRISLRVLATAYLIMASLKTIMLLSHVQLVNLIPIEGLIIASLQAPLFAFALIILINPRFIRRKHICTQILPVIFFIILFCITSQKWGNPEIQTFDAFQKNAFHPTLIIREIFLLYYLFQLLYLTRLFEYQSDVYNRDIDNYFADSFHLRFRGIRHSFYSALVVGVFAFISYFILSKQLMIIFEASYSLFYFIFGLYYIQYPKKFIYIEPAIYAETNSLEKSAKNKKRLVWSDLKNQIVDNKYYLKPGLTIEDLAQQLKVGRTTLSTFINNEEGMNFNAWINFLRVEEAKSLLINYPDYNLIQIAELIGYSEPSNFSRQFKLITKQSPSVWRLKCQTISDNYRLN